LFVVKDVLREEGEESVAAAAEEKKKKKPTPKGHVEPPIYVDIQCPI
jgi:hypothetical protein